VLFPDDNTEEQTWLLRCAKISSDVIEEVPYHTFWLDSSCGQVPVCLFTPGQSKELVAVLFTNFITRSS